MSFIHIDNVSKIYSKECKLDKVSFTVDKGDFLAIIGKEEAGKTPLLELIMGLKKCQTGTIRFEDDVQKRMLYVPDDIICFQGMSVQQYFKHIMKLYKVNDWDACKNYCEMFSINTKDKLMKLSYNENKSVAIIAALLANPECILLDEPYNFLSEENYKKFMAVLKEKNLQGMTVIITCEKFADVDGYANRYLYMIDGDLIKQDKIQANRNPWHMIHVRKGAVIDLDERKDIQVLRNEQDNILFIYKSANMKALSNILLTSQCASYIIEELTMEEEILGEWERWL